MNKYFSMIALVFALLPMGASAQIVFPIYPAPIADAGGPYTMELGGGVTFFGTVKSDPVAFVAIQGWDFNHDNVIDLYGSSVSLSAEVAERFFPFEGTFSVAFVVNDVFGKSGFDSATVQVSAVPEPETYAMLLAGLSLLAFVSRRRKKQTA